MAACQAAASSIAPFSITATPVKRGKAVAVLLDTVRNDVQARERDHLGDGRRSETSTMMTEMALHPRLRARASTAAPIGPSFSAISDDTLLRVSRPVMMKTASPLFISARCLQPPVMAAVNKGACGFEKPRNAAAPQIQAHNTIDKVKEDVFVLHGLVPSFDVGGDRPGAGARHDFARDMGVMMTFGWSQ